MPVEPRCAYCQREPVVTRWRPFCSDRCKLADLGRWLEGDYRIPGPAPDTPEPDDADDHEKL